MPYLGRTINRVSLQIMHEFHGHSSLQRPTKRFVTKFALFPVRARRINPVIPGDMEISFKYGKIIWMKKYVRMDEKFPHGKHWHHSETLEYDEGIMEMLRT